MDELIRYFETLYEAFNRRQIDAVLAMLSDDVDWPNAWQGGRLYGRDAVREYWRAQWAQIDPTVEPLTVEPRPDGDVAVRVRQTVRSNSGETLSVGQVLHTYRLRDGLITRMDVEELDESLR